MKSLKELVDKLFKGGDKTLKNLIIALIFGILLMNISDFIFPSKSINNSTNEIKVRETSKITYEDAMERKLRTALSNIKGAGKTDIILTIDYRNELILAENIKENNSADIKDESKQILNSQIEKTIVYDGNNNNPVVVTEKEPIIKGVLIISEGGENIKVKNDLQNAAQTLFDLPVHKVCVVSRNSG